MVLRLKTRESRSLPGLPSQQSTSDNNYRHQIKGADTTAPFAFKRHEYGGTALEQPATAKGQRPVATTRLLPGLNPVYMHNAGWSSPVARQAHNLKVVSSNLAPATKLKG
jgi:hypothetical protein